MQLEAEAVSHTEHEPGAELDPEAEPAPAPAPAADLPDFSAEEADLWAGPEPAPTAEPLVGDEEAGVGEGRTGLDSMGVAPVELFEQEGDLAGEGAAGEGEEGVGEFYDEEAEYEPYPIELTPVEEMENDPNMVYATRVIQKVERGRQARKKFEKVRQAWLKKKEEDRKKRKEKFNLDHQLVKEAEIKAMEERALSRVEGGGSEEAEKGNQPPEGSESGSAPSEGDSLSDDESAEAVEQRKRADQAESELMRVKEQLLEQSRKLTDQGASLERLRAQIGIHERKVEEAESRAASSDATREKDNRRVQAVIVALENSVQRLLNEKEDAEAQLQTKTAQLKESLERHARTEAREAAAREALDDVKANMQVLQDNEEELLMKLRQAQRKNDELRSHQEKETGTLKEKLARATRTRHTNLEKRIDTLFTLKGGLDALLDQMQEDAGREPIDYQERSIATRFPKVSPNRRRDYKSKGALSPSSPAARGHAPPHRVVDKTRLPHIPTV